MRVGAAYNLHERLVKQKGCDQRERRYREWSWRGLSEIRKGERERRKGRDETAYKTLRDRQRDGSELKDCPTLLDYWSHILNPCTKCPDLTWMTDFSAPLTLSPSWKTIFHSEERSWHKSKKRGKEGSESGRDENWFQEEVILLFENRFNLILLFFGAGAVKAKRKRSDPHPFIQLSSRFKANHQRRVMTQLHFFFSLPSHVVIILPFVRQSHRIELTQHDESALLLTRVNQVKGENVIIVWPAINSSWTFLSCSSLQNHSSLRPSSFSTASFFSLSSFSSSPSSSSNQQTNIGTF